MSDTSVQTAPSVPSAAAPAAGPAPKAAPRWTVRRALKLLASLELTVVLFVVALLLVFFGTLAQIDAGIGTVMKQYFRWWVVWVPVQLLVQFGQVFFGLPRTFVDAAGVTQPYVIPGSFPFPAGWTVGFLLLINLLAAHMIRFKLSWKRSGILLIHAGLIVLMLGELFTGLFAVEARMSIGVGETVNFTDIRDKVELAVLSPDKEDASRDHVVVIPDRLVRQPGKRISHDELPFDLEVLEFHKNSSLVEPTRKRPEVPNARQGIDGKVYGVTSDREASGVDTDAAEDLPSARVAFYRKGTDEKLGEHFLSLWYYPNRVNRQLEFPAQEVKLDGTTYEVALRDKRDYRDFAITLKEFRHDTYLGTNTPRNFSSLIHLEGDKGSERREAKIYMNNPLFYKGETFYQSGYFPDNSGTVLQVVNNPAWLMPYLSCTLVTLGMLIHFGLSLVTFLQRRFAS